MLRKSDQYPEVNHFVREPEHYKRHFDLKETAVRDASRFLSIQKGISLEKAEEFVMEAWDVKDTEIFCMRQNSVGDQVKDVTTFSEILQIVEDGEKILTPNLIIYENEKVNPSYLSGMVKEKMDYRDIAKGKQHSYTMQGKVALADHYQDEQQNTKTFINSISGAHLSPYNPLWNPTAHSALTSFCRTGTGYANAVIEWMIAGNRHYHTFEIVMNNLTSLICNADQDKYNKLINKYNLHIPTPEEVYNYIEPSFRKYWCNMEKYQKIRNYINGMSDFERCAVLYSSDLKALATFNDEMMRTFVSTIIGKPEQLFDRVIADSIIKSTDGDVKALVGVFCADFMRGKELKNIMDNDDEVLAYAACAKHITDTLDSYDDFIDCFLVGIDMPPNFWNFPSCVRNAVIGSDTDSAMFTCQWWVEWYSGFSDMSYVGDNVGSFFCYIVSMKVAHLLAMASKQIGVPDEKLYLLKMKNEYAFKVYMVANRAKHYATLITSCEGMVYKKPKLDLKGVGLKDSKRPDSLNNKLHKLLEEVMTDIITDGNVEVNQYLKQIANIEYELMNSFTSGEWDNLSQANVKAAAESKNPLSQPYLYHTLWEDVWSLKYGEAPPPQYRAVKVTLKHMNAEQFLGFVDSLPSDMQGAMLTWMEKYNKKTLAHVFLPVEAVRTHGILEELHNWIDARSLSYELMGGFYIVLEMLSFYYRNKFKTRLITDDIDYTGLEELSHLLQKS